MVVLPGLLGSGSPRTTHHYITLWHYDIMTLWHYDIVLHTSVTSWSFSHWNDWLDPAMCVRPGQGVWLLSGDWRSGRKGRKGNIKVDQGLDWTDVEIWDVCCSQISTWFLLSSLTISPSDQRQPELHGHLLLDKTEGPRSGLRLHGCHCGAKKQKHFSFFMK